MKKCLILVLCLLLISTCSIFAAHSIIDPKKDQVLIEETILYGGLNEAAGLSVTTHIGASGHLFWDTCCEPGKAADASTDFRFSHKEEHHFEAIDDLPVVLEMTNDMSAGGIIEYDSINDALKHVADNTDPSERRTETVDLRDFYDFFPLGVRINLGNDQNYYYFNSTDPFFEESDPHGILTAFNDFFKFPIAEPYMQTVTIQKDIEGNIIELQVDSADNADFFIDTVSKVSKNNCWFTFKFWGEPRPDTSCIPGGYGIYCMPFSSIEEGDTAYKGFPTVVHPEQLRNAYPLNENTDVMDLYYDERFDHLIFTTVEEGWHWVTVLDGSTGEELQRFKSMPECLEGTGGYMVFHEEDLMVIKDVDGRFAVIEINEKGALEQVLVTSPLSELDSLSSKISTEDVRYSFDFGNNTGFFWDGERFAVSSYVTKFHPSTGDASFYMIDSCDFFTLVIDKEGLIFAGMYDTSLDSGSESSHVFWWNGLDYYDRIAPIEGTPITVVWE